MTFTRVQVEEEDEASEEEKREAPLAGRAMDVDDRAKDAKEEPMKDASGN